jgi:plastocyanin
MMVRTMVLLVVMGSALGACAQPEGGPETTASPDPVDDPVITIEDMAFQGGSVTVVAGTTVTWVWEDAPIQHDVVSDEGLFESPLQAQGEWSHTFAEPGSFPYHCQPHPHMTGTVTVVPPDDEL